MLTDETHVSLYDDGGAPRPPLAWWGDGPPPHERWPGVTIDFKAQWSNLRDRWETHDGAFFFDMQAADDVCDFFPTYLRHHIGEFAGEPFVLRPDQALLMVRPLFGWKRTADGLRRFRKLFAFCPKGYGKSPLGAALAIFLARCDHEPAAEVYAVAADREQARTVHDNSKVMVLQSTDLYEGCQILKNSIVWEDLHSVLKVLSADAETKHGFRPHGVIFDELHAQRNRDLFEALRKSMAKRRQPMMIIITHAGTDDQGICFEEYELAQRVLGGSVDLDATLPVIFEMKKEDDWSDPAVWRRVNPGHGVTIKHQDIVEECKEALVEPRKRNDFLRYHGNRWTNAATSWLQIDWWDGGRLEALPSDEELQLLEIAAGLDLAQKWDLACFCLVFRKYLTEDATLVKILAEDEKGNLVEKSISLNYMLYIVPFFWIPEDTMMQHEKEDGVPYPLWALDGLVTPTPGPVIDYSRIYSDITTKILPRFPRLKDSLIGYDPAFATDLAVRLRDLGKLPVVEVLQNYKMLSEPAQVFEGLAKGHRLKHDGHKVMRWNIENVCVKTDDAGRIRPVKPRNMSKRIDGVLAAIMGSKALALAPPAPRRWSGEVIVV